MNALPPIRYAIYTRQSVERLADFSSCQAQFQTCQDSVAALNDPRLQWCGQHFDDEGQSGSTLDRPAMRKLRKVVDLGGVKRIYAVALDRITRSMRDAIVLIDEFGQAGVDVHFVHQPELTFGAQGRFLRHVLAAFAESEREMIATQEQHHKLSDSLVNSGRPVNRPVRLGAYRHFELAPGK